MNLPENCYRPSIPPHGSGVTWCQWPQAARQCTRHTAKNIYIYMWHGTWVLSHKKGVVQKKIYGWRKSADESTRGQNTAMSWAKGRNKNVYFLKFFSHPHHHQWDFTGKNRPTWVSWWIGAQRRRAEPVKLKDWELDRRNKKKSKIFGLHNIIYYLSGTDPSLFCIICNKFTWQEEAVLLWTSSVKN